MLLHAGVSQEELFVSRSVLYVIGGLLLFAISSIAGCGNLYSMTAIKTGTTAKARIGQNVAAGNIVTLDGSQSVGANGGTLTYEWSIISKPEASKATLSDPTAMDPTFTADVAGQYTFQLKVTDTNSNTSEDTVSVTVIAPITPHPVADAGANRNAVTGSPVTLDGSGSSSGNGDLLTYSWAIVSRPPGSSVQLSSSSVVKPQFTPDVTGTYVFSLVVAVGDLQSSASTTTVIADTLNAIALTPTDVALGIGQSQQFYATGSFVAVGDEDISSSAVWSSSDTTVATVSSKGMVTATGAGTATISAEMAGTVCSINVSVGAAALSSLKIEKGPVIPPITRGQTLQLTATATFSDKSQQNVTELATWGLKSSVPGTSCITLSDAPGTKGLIQTTDQACYVPIQATYEGKQIVAYITVK